MCDEGWVLSGYQQIFNDPESVQYLFLYYLSEYIGGIWNTFFGCYGIYSFRLLAMLTIVAIAYLVYRLMKNLLPAWCIMAGMFWTFLCADYGIVVFYHNYLTALLAVCASLLLYNSLIHNSLALMATAGFTIGLSVFTRLPNLSLAALALVLVPYYIYTRNGKKTSIMLLSALCGFITGIASIMVLMLVSGHLDIFINAIYDGFSAAGNSKSTHNISHLIEVYANNYIEVARNIFLIFFVPAVMLFINRYYGKHNMLACTVILLPTYVFMLKATSSNVYTMYAVATFTCIVLLARKGVAKQWKYLSCIILINMYTLPLGSDWGIGNMGDSCIYMSGAFSFGVIYMWLRRKSTSEWTTRLLWACAIIFFLFILKRGAGNIANQCYFDDGYRWNKFYRINSPLATTFTTKKNCDMLDPMLQELAKYVKEDDYLLCFQNIATVHFLTKTRPYLYNPWVWTYDPANMAKKFEKAEKEHSCLPVIVRDKSMLPRWYEPYPDWNNDNAEETYLHKNEKIKLINRFISKHGYTIAWENDVFQILLPPKTRRHRLQDFHTRQ